MTGRLPPGLFELADRLGESVDRRLGRAGGSGGADPVVGDARYWVEMPARLGAAAQPGPVAPPAAGTPAGTGTAPVAWGDGALCVDLGPDDGATWERFAVTVRSERDPEAVAAAAQEWRLAVTPYRRLEDADATAPPACSAGPAGLRGPVDLRGARVLDLTSMWAGPLCTHLLTRAGAVVTKIESAARPDGLRGSPMHRRLNDAKTVLDLDLRRPPDRREFDRLLAASDLLVTSLSLRALENFGLLPHQLAAAAPEAMTLAVTAFDAGSPEAGWIAYGTGVHAASGLGRLDDSARAQPPAWSYPDPLAGLRACAVAVEQLAARGAGAAGAHRHRRVSLAGAVRPLVEQARRCRAAADD